MRVKYGACLAGGAFVLLGVVFGIAASRFTAAADVTAAVGSVATVIGTIVGAYFGIHIGSAGKETAEAKHAHAEKVARVALGKLDPHAADEVLKVL
jgi:phage tail tape-measure protein